MSKYARLSPSSRSRSAAAAAAGRSAQDADAEPEDEATMMATPSRSSNGHAATHGLSPAPLLSHSPMRDSPAAAAASSSSASASAAAATIAAHAAEAAPPASSRLYLHANGNLLSARLIPPLRGFRGGHTIGIEGAAAGLSPAGPIPRVDRREQQARAAGREFLACPVASIPNPHWSYSRGVSGVDSARSLSFLSWLTFHWVSPLIATGFKRDIDTQDLWLLPEAYMAHRYTPHLFATWHGQDMRHRLHNRFGWTIWKAFAPQLKRMWVAKIGIICLTLSRPVILALLLRGVTGGEAHRWESFGYIVALASVSLIQALATHHFWWIGVSVAMSSRGACIGLIYDKSLKLHSSERAHYTSGRIANLANVDCDNIRDFMWGGVHESWASPVVILLTSVALFLLLGVSALVGVALLVASLSLTGRLCAIMSVLQDQIMTHGDARISLMVELIQSMKLIKLYAWESLFIKQVGEVRAKQVRSILRQSFVGAANRCLGLSIPLLVSFATFTCFILTNGYGSLMSHTLDASTAFTSLLLFNMLKEPMGKLPECMSGFIRMKISLERVERFLVCREKEEYTDYLPSSEEQAEKGEADFALKIDSATFDWGVRADPEAADAEESSSEADKKNAAVKKALLQGEQAVHSADREAEIEAEIEAPPPAGRRSTSGNSSHLALTSIANGNGGVHVIGSDEFDSNDEADMEEAEALEEEEMAETAARAHESQRPDADPAAIQMEREQRREAAEQARIDRAHARAQRRLDRQRARARSQSQHSHGNGGTEVEMAALSSSAATGSDALVVAPAQPTLPSLSLCVPEGALWMILGPVGSGKSSLLAAILGEMQCLDDFAAVPPSPSQPAHHLQLTSGAHASKPLVRRRRIAYTSQVSWLESASIRDNILFGRAMDERRYREAIHVAALEPDLARFKAGEFTIVGENGLNMSGGQKARLVVARAVYADADLYLFDEPLSAVDAHVARYLYDHVIGPQGVLKHKTRILVTHQLQFASSAVDCIVVMKEGRILAQGSYDAVQAQGVDLSTILQQTHNLNNEAAEASTEDIDPSTRKQRGAHAVNDGEQKETEAGASNGAVKSTPLGSPVPESPAPSKGSPTSGAEQIDDAAASTAGVVDPSIDEPAPVQYADEDLQQGRMSKTVYLEYFRAGAGILGYTVVLLIVALSQAASLSSDYFLANWSTSVTRAVAAAQAANEANNAGSAQQPQSHPSTPQLLSLVPSFALFVPSAFTLSPLQQQHSSIELSADSFLANFTHPGGNATVGYESFLPHAQSWYIAVYGSLVFAAGLLLLIRSIYIASTTVRSAATLHDRLFSGVVGAPQWFFEATPSGRILNRFAKDQEQVDMVLPGCVQDILACGIVVLGTLALIILVAPWSTIGLAVIAVLYHRVQLYYHPTSRQLKRLESITRSPIYQHMGETASGITTIRAYEYSGSLQRCMATLYARVDSNTRLMYYSFSVHRWLGVRLEAIGAVIVLMASSTALYLESSLGVGLVGLSISTTLGLAGNLNWTVRQVSEMENQLNAVERILEYASLDKEETIPGAAVDDQASIDEDFARTDEAHADRHKRKGAYTSLSAGGLVDVELEPEAEDLEAAEAAAANRPTANGRAPPGWPAQGGIVIEDLSIAYRPDPAFPLVLSNVSARIQPGEKIGIVGRTGAGKSTLALALFRLISTRSGRILIDDIDISQVSLRSLRRGLSVIPQDPLLFHNSLRKNLDPYGSVSEARLWEVLEQVSLKATVAALPSGLDFVVSDSGENFSLGQRQLICLARALVRNSRIVIMDEATAALDFETDQLMRRVVSSHFAHATVLTIAHRLNTILNSSRIMVFDAGKLVEFDTPKALLSDREGYLTWLVEETNAAGKLHQAHNPEM